MKTIILIVSILLVSGMISCEKFKFNPSVKKYVEALKNNEYDYDYLPAFKPKDIPELLEYADDFSEVEKFPANILASRSPRQPTVGICVLWTIESIRIFYKTDSEGDFPSLVPELFFDTELNSPPLNDDQLMEAYNLYNNWWYDNENQNFEITRNINPLENSEYSW